MTAEERAVYEERAAIMEYEGGMPRDEAERRAAKVIEGRADEPEQLQLTGTEEFQRAKKFFRELFGDRYGRGQNR